MDKDLQEIVKSFSGYGVESWMKSSLYVMAIKVQELRDAIRACRDGKISIDKLYDKLPEGVSRTSG